MKREGQDIMIKIKLKYIIYRGNSTIIKKGYIKKNYK